MERIISAVKTGLVNLLKDLKFEKRPIDIDVGICTLLVKSFKYDIIGINRFDDIESSGSGLFNSTYAYIKGEDRLYERINELQKGLRYYRKKYHLKDPIEIENIIRKKLNKVRKVAIFLKENNISFNENYYVYRSNLYTLLENRYYIKGLVTLLAEDKKDRLPEIYKYEKDKNLKSSLMRILRDIVVDLDLLYLPVHSKSNIFKKGEHTFIVDLLYYGIEPKYVYKIIPSFITFTKLLIRKYSSVKIDDAIRRYIETLPTPIKNVLRQNIDRSYKNFETILYNISIFNEEYLKIGVLKIL